MKTDKLKLTRELVKVVLASTCKQESAENPTEK